MKLRLLAAMLALSLALQTYDAVQLYRLIQQDQPHDQKNSPPAPPSCISISPIAGLPPEHHMGVTL